MTIPPFNSAEPIVSDTGTATQVFRRQMTALIDAANDTATLAAAAVTQGTRVIASGGLQVGGALGPDVGVALYAVKTTVALLPTATRADGDWAYAKDGRLPGQGAGAGTGVPCFYSRGVWIAVTSGAAVTA